MPDLPPLRPDDARQPDDPAATLPPDDPDATLPPPSAPGDAPTLAPEPDSSTLRLPGAAPEAIPGYVLEGQVGRGGMGVVYKARQIGLNRTVALKMVLSGDQADPRELVRFLAEAEAVAAVRHPNVVQVYGYGDHAGRPFIAMEYLDGGSLADVLQVPGRLPPMDAAALVERLAKAVQAAHDLGIVHRDLKPANILFAIGTESDSQGTNGSTRSHSCLRIGQSLLSPKVTDFGLAKRGSHDLTRTGAVMGTPAYMAPEQAKGQTKFVGPAADVYALGVILYECLAGTVPFTADDTVSLIMKVAEEEPAPVRTHAPHVPRDLDLICLKCLAKDPKKRYPTAAALADDLRRFQDGDPITARPATLRERAGRWARKNPARATAAAAVIAFVAVGVGLAIYNSRLQRQRADELQELSEQAIRSAATAREQKAAADASAADARTAQDKAQTAEQLANAAREDAVDQLYAANIGLAYREWQQNNVYRGEQLLNETPPSHRGWEWRFLKSLARQEAQILRGHLYAVNDLAVSADGTRLASADANLGYRAWDLTSGRELLASDSTCGPFAFSLDNRTAFLVGGGSPKLVDQSDNRVLHTLPTEEVAAAIFTDGGKHLVTLSNRTGRATRWSVATGQKVADLPAKLIPHTLQTWAVGRARLSADGTQAVCRSMIGQADVWNLAADRNNQHSFQGTPMHADAFGFHPNGRLVAGGYADGTVYVWDVSTKQEVRRIHAHDGAVMSLAFSPDGKRLATAGADTAAKVWDVGTGTLLSVFRGHTAEVQAVTFTPDGKRLITGSADRSIRVWALTDTRYYGSLLGLLPFIIKNRSADELPLLMPQGRSTHATYIGHLGPTRSLAFAPDGRRVATTSSGDRVVTVWDLDANKELQKYGYYSNGMGAAAFSRDGKRLAAVAQIDWQSNPGKLLVYELGRDEPVVQVKIPPDGRAGSLPAVTFSPDGRHVVLCLTGGPAPRVRVFEVATGKETAAIPFDGEAVHTVTFTPDGRRLVIGTAARARGYDWPDRTIAFDQPFNSTRCLAVGPGGRIAVGYEDSRIDLFDSDGVTNRIEVKRLEGHVGPVQSVAFSPDGSRLVSAGGEMAVKVWDAKSGKELLTFREHTGQVYQVEWSADGRRVASAGHDSLKVWTVPVEDRDSTESWKLLYAERFDDPAVVKRWKNLGANWVVENGALRGVQQLTPGTSATWVATAVPPTGPLPRTVEVRYTVWSPAPKIAGITLYDTRTDLSIQPLFGAAGNRLGRLGAFVLVVQKSRSGMTDSGVPRDKYKFEPDRRYHVRVLRDKTRLSVTVNGEHVLTEAVVAGEAPVLTLSSAWGEAGDPIYFDDIEVRAPAAAVAERKLIDRFDAWCDELLARDLVAERIDGAADLTASDRQYLKSHLPTLTENVPKLVAAVAKKAYSPNLSPADAALAVRQASAALRLEPGNAAALFLRGLAEYRAGQLAAAEATMKECLAVSEKNEGSASPGPLAVLALVGQKTNRPDEARASLRRARDLLAGEDWATSPSEAGLLKLVAEAEAAVALPADPDGDAVRKLVFTAEVRGWNHADLEAHLSAFADDATVTYARFKAPSDQDVTLDKAKLAAVRAKALHGSAAIGFRLSFENVAVRVAGERAEMSFTSTGWHPDLFIVTAHEMVLRRTPAGWRIAADRYWPTALKAGGVLTEYNPEFFRKTDGDAEAARKDGDGAALVRSLLHSRRHKDALAAAREQVRKPGATADDHLRLAEAAFHAGEVGEMLAAFRAALAAKPDLEAPWFLTRHRLRLPVSNAVLYGLALHPSQQLVAAGGIDEKLHTWDLSGRKHVRSDAGHTGNVSDIQCSPDGTRVATIGDDNHLILREVATGKVIWNIVAHTTTGGTRLAFRPDGRQIITGGWDRGVKIWDAESGKLVRDLAGHTNSVLGVAWSRANPRRVATASYDGTARVWDPETGKQLFEVRGHKGRVGRVTFSPDGKLLATSGDDGAARLWDAETGAPRATLPGHDGQVEPIAFTPDGNTLVTGGTRDGRVVLWDVATGKRREVIRVPGARGVYGIVVTADGQQIVTADTSGNVRAWSLAPW